MANYIVNKNPQPSGEHEVHRNDGSCSYLPEPTNRLDLGDHENCWNALAEAKKRWPNNSFDGCYYCSSNCHTR